MVLVIPFHGTVKARWNFLIEKEREKSKSKRETPSRGSGHTVVPCLWSSSALDSGQWHMRLEVSQGRQGFELWLPCGTWLLSLKVFAIGRVDSLERKREGR